jgi:hypothetical protein
VRAGNKAPRFQFRELPLQCWSRDARGFLDFGEGIRPSCDCLKDVNPAGMSESSGRFEYPLEMVPTAAEN